MYILVIFVLLLVLMNLVIFIILIWFFNLVNVWKYFRVMVFGEIWFWLIVKVFVIVFLFSKGFILKVFLIFMSWGKILYLEKLVVIFFGLFFGVIVSNKFNFRNWVFVFNFLDK